MTFEQIFASEGYYKADSFAKGACFEIKKNSIDGRKELFLLSFCDVNDLKPEKTGMVVYDGLFDKDYYKVNIDNLF